jgi:hypothetical protein
MLTDFINLDKIQSSYLISFHPGISMRFTSVLFVCFERKKKNHSWKKPTTSISLKRKEKGK